MDLIKLLKEQNKEIILLGHDNIDCDSAISTILMSKWLNSKNIKNKIVICDKEINKETYDIMKTINIDLNHYKNIVKNDDMVFLVDHYKTIHSDSVIGCIDHHPTIENISYKYYKNEKASSASRMIYKLMLEDNYDFTKDEIYLVLLSIFMDTCSLKSSKFIQADKIVIDELVNKYNISYEELYKLGLCLTDLTMNLADICLNGRKNYIYNGINVSSSYIQADRYLDSYNAYIENIQSNYLNDEIKLWIFIISNLEDDTQREYRINKDDIKLLEHNKILSRGTDIMPIIEKNINYLV
jgi:inorganic pyrophosphatase/exopolyphosphatase